MTLPVSVKRARATMIAASAFWFVFGVIRMMLLGGTADNLVRRLLVVAVMMLGNGILLAFSGFMLYNRKQGWFYLAFFMLSTNIFLTITDQFGLLDFATLAVDCAAMVFLIQSWGWYKGEASAQAGEDQAEVL